MRLLRTSGLAVLGQVVFDSATQGLWLGNRKVGSQVVGVDRSLLPERNILGIMEKRKMKKKKNQQQNEKKCIDLKSDLGERNNHVDCHATALALGSTDEACREAEM